MAINSPNPQISLTDIKKTKAKEYIKNKQFKKAKSLMLQIIDTETPTYKILNKLGDISIELNEYKEAEKYYQQSIHTCPTNNQVYLKYAKLLHEYINDTNKAQQMYEKCIEFSCMRLNDECWFNYGKLMFQLNNFDKAEQYYLKCKDDRACIHYHLAKCLLKKNNIKQAKLALQKATQIQPTVVKYHYEYAKCLRNLQLYNESYTAFETAVRLSQYKDIAILNDFIQFLLDTNNHPKASEYLKIVERISTTENENKYDEFPIEEEGKYEDLKEEKKEDIDVWENVDDFVLTEYIRDVCDEFSSDLLSNLDEFIKRMTFLGVNSSKSRSRALHILEKMNDIKIDNDSVELAKKIKNGHTLEPFICIRCNVLQEFGGVELKNCLHKICYKCFKAKIAVSIKNKYIPICNKCGYTVSCDDISNHDSANNSNIIRNLKTNNSFGYSTIIQYNNHSNSLIQDNGNYHISMKEFKKNWENIGDSNIIESFDVKQGSDEWNKVILHIRDANNRKIERIQRIQHPKLWRKFRNYCVEQQQKTGECVKVGGFWHGTGNTNPNVIWKGNGFDTQFARIGKCLWFATENTYSMNGWQYNIFDAKQVFLAFVATGNKYCKFIRDNKILNVFKNEATYPAYVLTYTNLYSDFRWR